MNSSDTDNKQNLETLDHLLSVVIENREKRCAEVRESARAHTNEILKQAHTRVRTRMHRHIRILRERYRVRVSAAHARNQTLVRQQQQKADKAFLVAAWPALREALLALWQDVESRRAWIDAAITSASSTLLGQDWRIEHPRDFSDEELKHLKQLLTGVRGKMLTLTASDDIEAGLRIIAHGTVLDATLEGLLRQKTVIEATLIARIKP